MKSHFLLAPCILISLVATAQPQTLCGGKGGGRLAELVRKTGDSYSGWTNARNVVEEFLATNADELSLADLDLILNSRDFWRVVGSDRGGYIKQFEPKLFQSVVQKTGSEAAAVEHVLGQTSMNLQQLRAIFDASPASDALLIQILESGEDWALLAATEQLKLSRNTNVGTLAKAAEARTTDPARIRALQMVQAKHGDKAAVRALNDRAEKLFRQSLASQFAGSRAELLEAIHSIADVGDVPNGTARFLRSMAKSLQKTNYRESLSVRQALMDAIAKFAARHPEPVAISAFVNTVDYYENMRQFASTAKYYRIDDEVLELPRKLTRDQMNPEEYSDQKRIRMASDAIHAFRAR